MVILTEYDEIRLNNCVVHARTVYEGSNNNRQIVSNATIMLYSPDYYAVY